MKDALTNMLKVIMQNGVFLAQISADVAALKTVVSSLDPKIREALDAEVAARNDMLRPHVEEQRLMLEALRQGISQIPN